MNYWRFVRYQNGIRGAAECGANIKCNHELSLKSAVGLSLHLRLRHAGKESPILFDTNVYVRDSGVQAIILVKQGSPHGARSTQQYIAQKRTTLRSTKADGKTAVSPVQAMLMINHWQSPIHNEGDSLLIVPWSKTTNTAGPLVQTPSGW